MKRLTLLLALAAALVCAGTASSTSNVVCGHECWNWLGGDDYSIEWTDNPIVFSGDNASSVCLDHGGVKSVSYKPGQGWQGEAIIIAVVECMDGTQHEIDTSRRSTQSSSGDDGDGNPNHSYEEGPPPSDPYEDQGGTQYTTCPGTDDPAYDPNNEACW